ncbi:MULTISPECIES: cupin domain-containing protein [Aeromonas]|uniref:cupin domain-containing protein n=1 Tax=Aeromonas TaxID=642 RepID=UPI0032EF6CC0
MHTRNLLNDIPSPLPTEFFQDLVSTNHLRIERIVSHGHQTPPGEWYDQDEHEWVLIVQGEASLLFVDPQTQEQQQVLLGPGDHINIPARQKHRVEWTHPDIHTIWLCVFY